MNPNTQQPNVKSKTQQQGTWNSSQGTANQVNGTKEISSKNAGTDLKKSDQVSSDLEFDSDRTNQSGTREFSPSNQPEINPGRYNEEAASEKENQTSKTTPVKSNNDSQAV